MRSRERPRAAGRSLKLHFRQTPRWLPRGRRLGREQLGRPLLDQREDGGGFDQVTLAAAEGAGEAVEEGEVGVEGEPAAGLAEGSIRSARRRRLLRAPVQRGEPAAGAADPAAAAGFVALSRGMAAVRRLVV